MTKAEIIEARGLKDGFDEDRFEAAVKYAGLIDRSVSICFNSLINLEKKGLIKFSNEFTERAENE